MKNQKKRFENEQEVDKELRSTREGYGEALWELGKKDKNIVALSADLTESTKADLFARKFPKRFFQCGVAEQNMISLAVGLALEGKIPFASTFGVFILRALDQIRISVCYNQVKVKLVATHCGLATGPDGATHQALEDIAALRALPFLAIIEPADYEQAFKAVEAAAYYPGAVYLRLHRAKFPSLTSREDPFKIGQAQILQEGEKITFIGAGPILGEIVKAALILKRKRGFRPEIINCHTIKPLDKKTILKSVKKTKRVIVVQDHQIKGGLGSAIGELLSQKLPTRIEIIGMKDTFGESGQPLELWKKYGLTAKEIVKKSEKILD